MSKPRPNRLGMYADVRQILDRAIDAGGGEYICGDHGAAVHWRQRAYRFRKLFAEIHGEKNVSGYDRLVMPRVPPESATVVINVRTQVGTFIPRTDGEAITVGDELFDEAAEVAARLLGRN